MSRHAASTSTANGIVESGRAECSTSGRYTAAVSPAPSASTATRLGGSPRSSAASAVIRQARSGTSEPITTELTWAAANVVPKSAIGMAARNVGSGSHTSNAGRGKTSGGV